MTSQSAAHHSTLSASEGLRILAVGDDATARLTFDSIIRAAGWTPVIVDDPEQAYQILIAPDAPPIALIDWHMPTLSGIELCRRVRAAAPDARPYLIFVTANSTSDDIVEGLDAGADGYMTKPIVANELLARVRAGIRMIALLQDLRTRLAEATSAHTKRLPGLLPMCGYCRRIRDEDQQWSTLEQYLSHRVGVRFTHGFCPDCYEDYVRPDVEES
jgi:sigma-B regulation protein RsbU (phosphoserine phosphatase)